MAVNMAVGGAAALAALAVDAPGLRLVLWLVAAVNYLAVATNLNPLLELDGYYMLSDALERPNLRQESLAWLGQRAWTDLRSGRALRERRVELLYGLAAVGYATVLTVTTVMMYRGWVLEPLARVVPAWTAELVGVVVAAGVVAVLVAGVYQDLRGPVRS
jgi:putative peptide zinc metalloprotease protein